MHNMNSVQLPSVIQLPITHCLLEAAMFRQAQTWPGGSACPSLYHASRGSDKVKMGSERREWWHAGTGA